MKRFSPRPYRTYSIFPIRESFNAEWIETLNTYKNRRSHRLPNFDYTQSGAYFVTIVTFERACLFGEIKNGVMECNNFGDIARWEWECLPKRFSHLQIDDFIVMPNHAHAIIILGDSLSAEKRMISSKTENIPPVGARREELSMKVIGSEASPRLVGPKPGSLGVIIASDKSEVSRKINCLRHTPGQCIWQRDYYDHIIRDEIDWANIRLYIQTNPDNWERDDEKPPLKI